jgi:hypothetical protein
MKKILILLALSLPLIVQTQVIHPDTAAGEMLQVGNFYVDKYEAPNIQGEQPFVMFTYTEAQCWCQAKGKRLLFDDEWSQAAAGPDTFAYVYGDTYDSQICNDNKTWISPNQTLLNLWPSLPYICNINSFAELIDSVLADTNTSASATHVLSLYQADSSGTNLGCVSYYGIFDMNGNVSEWTTRRDGGSPNFHGNLKGGYWAGPSTIQSSVTAHADAFRYYNSGFRCAADSITVSNQMFNKDESLIVYPNPASDHLNIKHEFQFPVILDIISVYGKVISTHYYNDSPMQIDISGLADGVYFINITDKNGKSYRSKVIKI